VTDSDDGSGEPAWLSFPILDGDASASPRGVANGGAGGYDVLVYKSGAGAETYTFSFHYTSGPDGTGLHAGTSRTTRQSR
jgi:hypothetical protein